MKWGKLATLVVLGALAWQHEAILRDKADLLLQLPSITNTYMEMRGFRIPLRKHIQDNGGRIPPPRELRSWLNRHFETRGKEESAVDYFGNPYRVEYGPLRAPRIRSCGPDGRCDNDDDLVVEVGRVT